MLSMGEAVQRRENAFEKKAGSLYTEAEDKEKEKKKWWGLDLEIVHWSMWIRPLMQLVLYLRYLWASSSLEWRRAYGAIDKKGRVH